MNIIINSEQKRLLTEKGGSTYLPELECCKNPREACSPENVDKILNNLFVANTTLSKGIVILAKTLPMVATKDYKLGDDIDFSEETSEANRLRFFEFYRNLINENYPHRGMLIEGFVAGFLRGELANGKHTKYDIIIPDKQQLKHVSKKSTEGGYIRISVKTIYEGTINLGSVKTSFIAFKEQRDQFRDFGSFKEFYEANRNNTYIMKDFFNFVFKDVEGFLFMKMPGKEKLTSDVYDIKYLYLSRDYIVDNHEKYIGITYDYSLKINRSMTNIFGSSEAKKIIFPFFTVKRLCELSFNPKGVNMRTQIRKLFGDVNAKYVPNEIVEYIAKGPRKFINKIFNNENLVEILVDQLKSRPLVLKKIALKYKDELLKYIEEDGVNL